MALITCPECGGKISDKAETCIHCGYPLKKYTEYIDYKQIINEINERITNLTKPPRTKFENLRLPSDII